MIGGLLNRQKSTRRNRPASGAVAERFAADFLKRQGLKIAATNYRCRSGEIDIVARHGDSLVFVEVRLRNHRGFASGAESVDARKQRKLTSAASHFLQKNFGNCQPPCRFDVVSLATKGDNGGPFEAEWIQDAFRPEG